MSNPKPAESPRYTLDIKVYEKFGEGHWAQARYLVRGYGDILWTNYYGEALDFIENSILTIEAKSE